MNDERDFKTRQAAHENHAVWLSQHAALGSEAEGWLRRLEDHARTLDQLRKRLDGERARIETHIEGIRLLGQNDGRADVEMRRKLVEHYGERTADCIEVVAHAIRMGNLTGNFIEYWRLRLLAGEATAQA